MKRIIVTSDDFGAAFEVNEAVERAHVDGVLSCASLMVTGPAAEDAVARARRLPRLGVGLHLVLVEGVPALPPEQLPDLVDTSGRFRTDMARAGATMFFKPAARAQLAAEITAQFAAFARTGLPLDHVNAHKHFHLHPTIAGLVIAIGRRFGMKAVRAPVEPFAPLAAVEPVKLGAEARIAGLWAKLLRRRLRRAGLSVPDQVFGLAWSGAVTADRLAGLLPHVPDGVTEIYAHPATDDAYPGHYPGYSYEAELGALLDPRVMAGVAAAGGPVRFADLRA
ncbi:MAG: hopanoid biosynthesis-associated protein HpnK [Sphingomonas sp.]|uniref:hopanoid biosynthesis-associated protein HpnK n=1 Tax=Sphingomonas sp. TaxID=28214 RepID=UPI0025CBDA95|nr:hopanoid biosynthesis-associated protein HpnK [Sphingomonas sp.]MBX9882226.1 hopanoid biosynthesis-associated protein HpnK [Sphingomonas sp.]